VTGFERDVPARWPVHAQKDVWSGPAPFSVRLDTVSAPTRPQERFTRLVVQHPGAVVVLAVDEQERALVLSQYRHAVGLRMIELPAGLLDAPGEDPEAAGRRELREEALLLAGSWEHLLATYSSPGIVDEQIHYFLARDLSPAPDRGDFEPAHEEADMSLAWVPVTELVDGVLAGRLTDGPLAQAVMAYALRRR
jgi:ADP-ribose pyrophosphatase